ncbi:MAG TPA: adenylate/guanylate cyclase domain-containing protein [Leptospiraceae bacterium]|nr:adenylate/guanylate cyclase domain-containing protein [Leptospiraceae bacterium]
MSSSPAAKSGHISVSADALKSDPLKLDGEWIFFWKKFIPASENLEGQKEVYLKVPASWNEFQTEEGKAGGMGYGTYILYLHFPKESVGKIFTLKIPHMGTAYRMWVGETPVSESGKVGTSYSEMRPAYITRTKSFVLEKETVRITVHVSNFHHKKGGMRFDSIVLGEEEQIRKITQNGTLYVFFLLGSLVIMAVYHYGLFFLRKEDIAALVFGGFCTLMGVRLLTVGDVWITALYPDLDWDLQYKIEYLSLFLTAPAFMTFIRYVFKDVFYDLVLKTAIFIYSILCIIVIFTKPVFFSNILVYFQVFSVVNAAYGIYVMSAAVFRRKEGSAAALSGFSFFVLTVVNDLLYNYEIIVSGYGNLMPLGVFVFIFSQSFILSQIFSNAFNSVKTLSKNLALTNESYSRFVPVEFLKFLDKESIIDIQLGDQMQKEMTVLFSDIRSFTDLSERMTPRENFNFLNSYLKRMNPHIQKNRGFIDKYIGDSIMALFPSSAEDAVNAAVDMLKEIRVYNQHRLKVGYDPIKVGFGIHIGNLMLGIIGADERMEGTVIADSVNLASRIEGLTKIYDSPILISEEILTKMINPSLYNYRYIDKVRVKGKQHPITVYEVYDGQPDFMIELKNSTKPFFEEGIARYQEQRFDLSAASFTKVLEINPNDTAAQIYLKRSRYYKENGILSEDAEGNWYVQADIGNSSQTNV